MHTANIWNKLYLYGQKIVILLLACFFLSAHLHAQRRVGMNIPNYDNKKYSYGFLIGLHSTSFKLRYSDEFISNDFDTLHSILPQRSPGFSLGFIVNRGLNEFFDVRILPKVAFYEHDLEYNFTDESQINQLKESTVVEFPLMLKYKSTRRKNSRMYMVGGVKPAYSASGRTDLDSGNESINIQRFNISTDFGFGFDMYFPLFKFSPEVRFSKGMSNMLTDKVNIYSEGISRLSTNTINFYLLFQ
ncbi:MAG: PorT family protein [Cyclobacteriaceae bacterium]|nr:PorT family protein [Cyclobacteriaceae bacterium]